MTYPFFADEIVTLKRVVYISFLQLISSVHILAICIFPGIFIFFKVSILIFDENKIDQKVTQVSDNISRFQNVFYQNIFYRIN